MNQKLPIYVISNVVKGFGRGSKDLGCPTSNMAQCTDLGISNGIYTGLVQLIIQNESQIQEDGFEDEYKQMLNQLPKVFPVHGMVCSYGFNPQYGNKKRSLEVHILEDFKFNFYGAKLRVLICKRLRDELKFESIQHLKDAIENDKRNSYRELPKFEHLKTDTRFFNNLL